MTGEIGASPWLNLQIAPPSYWALYLTMWSEDVFLGRGSGFLVATREGRVALATARHNFTGRHHDTNEFRRDDWRVPTHVVVRHTGLQPLTWVDLRYPLYRAGPPVEGDITWLDDGETDIALLPIQNWPSDVAIHGWPRPPDEQLSATWDPVGIAEDVSIVGFPFGESAGGSLGIWSRGSLASEWMVAYQDAPAFLIDSRTREGQSGAMVIQWIPSGVRHMGIGGISFHDGPFARLLGVYSGRINKDSDLGRVWSALCIWSTLDRVTWS